MPKYPEPEVGMQLATRNGNRYTNAIVIGVTDEHVKILSDFGNTLTFIKKHLYFSYTPAEPWLEAKLLDYPFDTLEERLQHQIKLLQKALHEIHQ